MTTLIYIAAGFGCVSIGACIGLVIGGILCAARRTDEQDDEFFRVNKPTTNGERS